jgi:hypothetical protein
MPTERSRPSVALRSGATGLLTLLTLLTQLAGASPAGTAPEAPATGAIPPAAAAASAERDDPPDSTAEVAAVPVTGRRLVFVCEDAGIPMFSDRPCGAALAPRSVSFPVAPAGAAASTLPPPPRAGTRPRPQPVAARGPGDAAAGRCAALQRQLEELDDRMRAGYSSREAARLWNRWRDLRNRLRSARC